MINDLFRTYKKIILLLLVLLCSVVFWFYGCRHQQRSQSEVVEWNKKGRMAIVISLRRVIVREQ